MRGVCLWCGGCCLYTSPNRNHNVNYDALYDCSFRHNVHVWRHRKCNWISSELLMLNLINLRNWTILEWWWRLRNRWFAHSHVHRRKPYSCDNRCHISKCLLFIQNCVCNAYLREKRFRVPYTFVGNDFFLPESSSCNLNWIFYVLFIQLLSPEFRLRCLPSTCINRIE